MDYLQQLKDLQSNTNPRVFGQVLSYKHKDLLRWVESQLDDSFKDKTLREKVFYIVNKPEIYCPEGNRKTFSTKRNEYGFCNNVKYCKCFKDAMPSIQKNVNRDMNLVKEKRIITWMAKYGVDNPSKNKEISKKAQDKRNDSLGNINYQNANKKKLEKGYHQVCNYVSNLAKPMFSLEEYKGSNRKHI